MAKRPAIQEEVKEEGPAWTARLVGHDLAEQSFLQAFGRDRVPHAWLITGPKGIGKATLAYRMARFLLSQGGDVPVPDTALFDLAPAAPAAQPTLDLDASSRVFRQVAQQAHPDFRLLERAINERTGKLRSEIIVDDVREVIDFLRLKPSAGAWRVVIVDSADDLNRNAANALLKILEEPSAQTCLFLVSHAPRSLLPTILSRCRKLALNPISHDLLMSELDQRFGALPPADRALTAALAEGSLGRALHLIERGGAVLFAEIGRLLATWPRLDVTELHRLGDRLAGRGAEADFDLAVEMLGWWFARFARLSATGLQPHPELFAGEADLMRRLGNATSLDRWLELWEKVSRLFDRVQSVNLDRKQAWIAGFLAIEGLGR